MREFSPPTALAPRHHVGGGFDAGGAGSVGPSRQKEHEDLADVVFLVSTFQQDRRGVFAPAWVLFPSEEAARWLLLLSGATPPSHQDATRALCAPGTTVGTNLAKNQTPGLDLT